MMLAYELAALGLSLLGVCICLAILLRERWAEIEGWVARYGKQWLRVDQIHRELAKAGWERVPIPAWLGVRIVLALIGALASASVFEIPVLILGVAVMAYQLPELVLEVQQLRHRLERQQALLDAICFGAAIMSRGGSASDMLKALSSAGPTAVRPIFKELTGAEIVALSTRVEKIQERLAEPLFDDLALALTLHWKRGAKLAPALKAIAEDWEESLRLRREAKALRAGVEASVSILTVLPLAFLILLQGMAPGLLTPFHSWWGQLLLSVAMLWMLLGHRILRQMSKPPEEARVVIEGERL